jgi:hypothetical protein
LETLALALVVLVACLLPAAISWALERRARAAFVRERCGGARLMVRPLAPATVAARWLQRRGLELPWAAPAGAEGSPDAGPHAIRIGWLTAAAPATVAVIAWIWLGSELTVRALDPECRSRGA